MNCSTCGEIINPISGKNYGAIDRPICEKCVAIQDFKQDEASISESYYVCVNHPKVIAKYFCRMCDAPLCKTCVFEFDNNVLLCPNCVNKPQPLSARQKNLLNWSYLMAAITTFLWVFVFLLGAIDPTMFKTEDIKDIMALIGALIWLFIKLGPMIGLLSGIKARFKHQKNPASIKIALIWNISLIGFLLLLIIINILIWIG